MVKHISNSRFLVILFGPLDQVQLLLALLLLQSLLSALCALQFGSRVLVSIRYMQVKSLVLLFRHR